MSVSLGDIVVCDRVDGGHTTNTEHLVQRFVAGASDARIVWSLFIPPVIFHQLTHTS